MPYSRVLAAVGREGEYMAWLGWHTPSAPGSRSDQSLCCGRLSSPRSCPSPRSSTVLSYTGAASTPQFKLLSASRSLCAGSSADSTRLDLTRPSLARLITPASHHPPGLPIAAFSRLSLSLFTPYSANRLVRPCLVSTHQTSTSTRTASFCDLVLPIVFVITSFFDNPFLLFFLQVAFAIALVRLLRGGLLQLQYPLTSILLTCPLSPITSTTTITRP